MGLLKCSGCVAKDSEISFLRGQLDVLSKRVLELADPGINHRLERVRQIKPEPDQIPIEVKVETFPSI
jgi:hypothetical protein